MAAATRIHHLLRIMSRATSRAGSIGLSASCCQNTTVQRTASATRILIRSHVGIGLRAPRAPLPGGVGPVSWSGQAKPSPSGGSTSSTGSEGSTGSDGSVGSVGSRSSVIARSLLLDRPGLGDVVDVASMLAEALDLAADDEEPDPAGGGVGHADLQGAEAAPVGRPHGVHQLGPVDAVLELDRLRWLDHL